MWRTLLVAVALLGCVDPGKGARWPGHRKDHDARLDKLASDLAAETRQIALLSDRIRDLEARLAAPQPPTLPAPSAPAAPSETPAASADTPK
jgi:hypothetical protein